MTAEIQRWLVLGVSVATLLASVVWYVIVPGPGFDRGRAAPQPLLH